MSTYPSTDIQLSALENATRSVAFMPAVRRALDVTMIRGAHA